MFNVALELPAAERTGYLDQACADDADLRQRVEELLKASKEFLRLPRSLSRRTAGTKRNRQSSAQPCRRNPATELAVTNCSSKSAKAAAAWVYMAEQEEPVRRRVALKVIKLGMDTKNVIAPV